ncbi:MAG: biotin--[acetyl-CoA-carboxylase] ligase [Duncaniella sp.]|nr:biotin--[acetyl-CoA-carboxylase] ligase [Duncaniella sp.]
MQRIHLQEVASTNTWLTGAADRELLPHGTVVTAHGQTAGRGQRGNTWESAPGANITMSVLLRPEGLAPGRQFVISQAVSLAIVEWLDPMLPGHIVSIKWPNDIYVDDCKICGILIENAITVGSITRSVVGIGLNVNQPRFVSDAPNPVSLHQLTGTLYDVDALADILADAVILGVGRALAEPAYACEALPQAYFRRLWRGTGVYAYIDHTRGVTMEAEIVSVASTGHITLREHPSRQLHTYAFKEISFIL